MLLSFTLFTSLTALTSARFVHESRAVNPCFQVGSTALPAEIQALVPSLSGVTCNPNVDTRKGVPDVTSGGIAFSTIDFAKDSPTLSPLAFSLEKFATPANPKAADLTLFQNQLNVYLATEVALRSQGPASSAQVATLKVPKFFLQFQIARITGNAAQVKHQAGKVSKNAVGTSKQQTAVVQALETCF